MLVHQATVGKMERNYSTIARLAVRNTVWVSVGFYISQITAFLATLVLTRSLPPEVFGHFALGLFWVGLLSLSTKFGLYYAAIRHTLLDPELLGTFAALEILLSVATLMLSLLAGGLLLMVGQPEGVVVTIVTLAVVSIVTSFTMPLGMALEREIQLSRLALVSIVATLFAYITGIFLARMGAGIWSLIAQNSLMMLLSSAGTVIVCRRRMPWIFKWRWRFDRQVAKQLLQVGVPIGLSNTANSSIISQYDNFLIGTFVGPATLGYYDRAYRTSQWANLLLTSPLIRVSLPTFSRVHDDPPRLAKSVQIVLWGLTTLGVPIALFVMYGASDIIKILYTSVWQDSAPFLSILALFTIFTPFAAVAQTLAIAQAHQRWMFILTVTQAMIMVCIGTPLTWWFGVNGTLLAVGLTALVGFVLGIRYMFSQKLFALREIFGPAIIALLISYFSVEAISYIPGWSQWTPILRLSAIAVSGPGIYTIMIFMLRPKETWANIQYLVEHFKAR